MTARRVADQLDAGEGTRPDAVQLVQVEAIARHPATGKARRFVPLP